MALFAKKTEEDRQLASACRDLEAAQRKLSVLLAREDAAAASQDRWGQWIVEREAATAEVARLTALVKHLQAATETVRREAETAAIRKKVEACRATNAAVAERLRIEGPQFTRGLLALARDAAAAAAEAQRLNLMLPSGVEPIAIGDFAARDLPILPREDLATGEEELWVNGNGDPVGDQDAVTQEEDGTGTLQISRSTKVVCRKRRFRRTTFHPSFAPDPAGYFFSLLRLPFPDRPGLAFDGARMVLEHVAEINLDPPATSTPTSRPIRAELVPLEPWPSVRDAAD